MKHFTTLLILLTVLCCAMTVCADAGTEAAGEKMITYSKDGLVLSIPERFTEFITVETPADRDHLFSFFHKESAVAGKTSSDFPEDAGLIFVIDIITEEKYHDLLCNSSFFEVFAKDDNGNYYTIFYPSYSWDNSYFIFEIAFLNSYPYTEPLNPYYPNDWVNGTDNKDEFETIEWIAKEMKNKFITDNGLTAEKHGEAPIVNYFANIIYGNTPFTVDNLRPNNVKVEDYLLPFVYDVSYKPKVLGWDEYYTEENDDEEEEETSNWPGVSIRFPDKRVKLPGDTEYLSYRSLWIGDNYISSYIYSASSLDQSFSSYEIIFEDETSNSGEIINNFLNAVKLNTTPSYIGTWIADLYYSYFLEFKETEFEYSNDLYATVKHGDSTWTMKVQPSFPLTSAIEDRNFYVYTDGKRIDREWNSDYTAYQDTVVYEDGQGEFLLLYNGTIKWIDETEQYAHNENFILYSY